MKAATGRPPLGMRSPDPGAPTGPPATTRRGTGAARRSRRGAAPVLLAGVTYVVLSVGLWWNVWSSHPASTTTCGCGDAARFLWFFAWPPVAIAHGHGLLWSSLLFHPTGINLLDDTSVLGLSVLLAPLTAATGPVLAMNVGLTLAPTLSALAMWALVRRWVGWAPAAFLAGLVYGFSPFVVTELALNQLNIAFLPIPPLVVLVLDELLVRQRRGALWSGTVLAALVVAQYFVSTEVLLITVVSALAGTVLLLAWAAVSAPSAIGPRLGHAAKGTGFAMALAATALAYPLWFLVRGPAHLSGPVWSNGGAARFGTTVASLFSTGGLGQLQAGMARLGGYQGRSLVGLGYLGLGVVTLAFIGSVALRRDRRVLLFALVGLGFFLLSLAPGHGYFVPWQTIERVPLLGDVVEGRFTLVVTLCAAVVVGLTADAVHRLLTAPRARGTAGTASRRLAPWAMSALVLLPTVLVLRPNVPLTTRPVVLPEWFATVGRVLAPGQVLLTYPVPFSGLQSSQAWQAEDRLDWAQAGGGGPTGQANRAGVDRAGFAVLAAASLPIGSPPAPSAAHLRAVRQALRDWGVTTVVLPVGDRLPLYERGRPEGWALAFFTAALGAPPSFDHQAWVWDRVRILARPAAVPPTGAAFGHCASLRPIAAVPVCILR